MWVGNGLINCTYYIFLIILPGGGIFVQSSGYQTVRESRIEFHSEITGSSPPSSSNGIASESSVTTSSVMADEAVDDEDWDAVPNMLLGQRYEPEGSSSPEDNDFEAVLAEANDIVEARKGSVRRKTVEIARWHDDGVQFKQI